MESEEQINAQLQDLIDTSKKYANDRSLGDWIRKQYANYARYLQGILFDETPQTSQTFKTQKSWKTIDEFVENPRAWKIFHTVKLFDADDFAHRYLADLKLKGVRLSDIIKNDDMFSYFIRAVQTHQT